jgi:hypothetical protein
MKVQGKELVFDFMTAAKYDELAEKKGLKTIVDMIRSIGNEHKRIELKYGDEFDKLTDDQRSDFRPPMTVAEAFLLYQAALGLDAEKTNEILKKEGKSIVELMSEIMLAFTNSGVYQAEAIKAESENPKTPK